MPVYYRGAFLQGFGVANFPLFEEWTPLEESNLSQAFLRALYRLAAWAESRQEWEEAIGWSLRVVQADPIDEDAQRRLIRLYIRQGAVSLAAPIPAVRNQTDRCVDRPGRHIARLCRFA